MSKISKRCIVPIYINEYMTMTVYNITDNGTGHVLVWQLQVGRAVLTICAIVLSTASCAVPTAAPGVAKTHNQSTDLSENSEVLVGFLEDAERYLGAVEYIENLPQGYLSVKYKSIVRNCFSYGGGTWASLSKSEGPLTPAAPKSLDTWYAIGRGRIIGKVETARHPDILVPLGNSQELVSISFDPLKGSENEWFECRWGIEIRPPIILSSARHCRDPEDWHLASAPEDISPALAVLNAEHTHNAFPFEVPSTQISKEDVHVIKALANRVGDYLIVLEIKATSPAHDDGPAGSYSFWFARCGGSLVRFVGSGLSLIDIVDLDDDGLSEYLFWQETEAGYAYCLVLHQFVESRVFFWGR